jgi:hypothetical protein
MFVSLNINHLRKQKRKINTEKREDYTHKHTVNKHGSFSKFKSSSNFLSIASSGVGIEMPGFRQLCLGARPPPPPPPTATGNGCDNESKTALPF